SALRPRAQPIRCLGPSAPCAATRCLSSSADGATCCLGPMRGQPALAACCLGASAPCAATRFLGPKRSKQPAALAPRPHAQPTRCTLPRPSAPCTPTSCAASAPRPHAQQAARCLGPSAPCAAPRCLGPSAPCAANTLHAASAPRPLAQLARLNHACAACPPASCSSALRHPRPRLRGLPACHVVLLGRMALANTPARPARLRLPPAWFARLRHATRSLDAQDLTSVACPPTWCYSVARCPRPHLRTLPACVVLLGRIMPETTPAWFARPRRAPRPRNARDHQRGQPACVVLLGFLLLRHTCAASPPTSCSSASCSRDTPAWFAGLRRATRSLDARDLTSVAYPPTLCYSVARCPRPHLRGLLACVVLLGRTMPETTPAWFARLRRAPRPHASLGLDLTSVASPPASCSSASCSRDTRARPARLRRAPRPPLEGGPECRGIGRSTWTKPQLRGHTRSGLRGSAPRKENLEMNTPPRPQNAFGGHLTTRACRHPRSCSSAPCRPRPHLRGQPACVVLLDSITPETTPARPTRLRHAPRLQAARRGSPESCSSAPCRPRPHLRGQPACVVLLDSMPPETTPARPTRLRHAPRLQAARLSGHTRAVHPPASCSSTSSSQDTPARFTRLRRAPRPPAPRDCAHAANPP
ncbi:unnamed protein product, partial [Musa hybrid cultivar]